MNRKITQQQLISCGYVRSVNTGRRRPREIRRRRSSQAYHDEIGDFEPNEGHFQPQIGGTWFFVVVSLLPREVPRYSKSKSNLPETW